MASLLSKVAARVAPRVDPMKRVYQMKDPVSEVDAWRSHDVMRPRRWMVPGCAMEPGTLGGLECHALVPRRVRHPDRVVLFLHGGAYVSGPLMWHWAGCGSIARRAGVRLELPDYPRAPEATVRETVPAAVAAYENLIERFDPANVTVMGDSAGGGLAVALALELARRGVPKPRRLVLISPWIDLLLTVPGFAELDARDPLLAPRGLRLCGEAYGGSRDGALTDLASPIAAGDLGALPETSVFTGTDDLLTPSIREFVRRAREQGAPISCSEWDGQMHDWPLVPVIPEAIRARREIARLLQDG